MEEKNDAFEKMYREQERPLRQALLSFRNRKNARETGKKSLEMTILFILKWEWEKADF